jgi:hypothetical protein
MPGKITKNRPENAVERHMVSLEGLKVFARSLVAPARTEQVITSPSGRQRKTFPTACGT